MAKLSVRYATALYELAMERGSLGVFSEQAKMAIGIMGNDEFKNFILHPAVPKNEKYKFWDNVLKILFKDKVREELRSFLHLLIAKNRENIILDSLFEFFQMTQKGQTKAAVYSATPLSTPQKVRIQKLLEAKTSKKIEVEVKIKPEILGGMFIYIDEIVVDRSIGGGLNDMTEFIKKRAVVNE